MAGGSRSRSGCWTCRLRRKKCDERRPECATCEGLGIKCHAYGPRPEFMDGGEKEKAAAADVRRGIKNAARREPASNIPDRNTSNAPSTGQSPARDSNSQPEKELENSVLRMSPQGDVTSTLWDSQVDQGPLNTKSDSRSDSATSPATLSRNGGFNGFEGTTASSRSLQSVDYSLPQALKGREASLLMYYMDYVFPLQFRMYDPTAIEGGRGWLLSLLLRTPPMYHMTLALSAHVFEMAEVPNGAKERKQASLAQLGLALQNLQVYIRAYSQKKEASSLEDSIKLLACILQMIAFITFAGGIDNWQIHLKGATDIALGLTNVLCSSAPFPETVSSPQSSTSSHESEGRLLFNEDEISLKFCMAVFIWIDITSCVALGSSPFLSDHHERLLGGSNPPVRLDKVAGIQNWVLISIGKIASLDAWRRKSLSSGTLSIVELVKRATQLETELKQALNNFTENRKGTSKLNQSAKPHLTPLSIHADYLTELYASSALTYLHVIVSGPYPELPEIRENVCRTMELLKKLPNPNLARAMWWPLLITGSLAVGDEQALFRNFIKESGVNESSLGAGYNILRTLEECWRRHRMSDPVPPFGDGYWGDVMSTLQLKVMVM